MENDFIEYYVLEKHKYPKWVLILFIFMTLVFITVVPSFLLKELPDHYALNEKILEAKQHFSRRHYQKAAQLYRELLEKYPNFKRARIEAIKAYFALSYNNSTYLTKGYNLLGKLSYEEDEISEMAEFLPARDKEKFKAGFSYKDSIDYLNLNQGYKL